MDAVGEDGLAVTQNPGDELEGREDDVQHETDKRDAPRRAKAHDVSLGKIRYVVMVMPHERILMANAVPVKRSVVVPGLPKDSFTLACARPAVSLTFSKP